MADNIITNGAKVADSDEDLQNYFEQAMRTYISLRDIASPYYGFTSITAKWNEYDRCYEVRAKDDRKEHEYTGFSNIVTPDFHRSIEVKGQKEYHSLFNGAPLFDVKATKHSTEDDAILARKLAQYSMDCNSTFDIEVKKCLFDRRKYGTAFAYIPWTVEDRLVQTLSVPIESDSNGQMVMGADGQPVPTKDGKINDFEQYEQIKYTGFQHVDTRRVWLNQNIESIESQQCIFLKVFYSYSDLLDMEDSGLIEEGMADYVKETYRDTDSGEQEDNREERSNEDSGNLNDRKLRSFGLYLVYHRKRTDRGQKMIESIYMYKGKVLGTRDYIKNKYPILKTCYIPINDFAYGIGQGDIIYPTYIAKCARINQVYDRETKDVLGGGFKDKGALPSFKKWRPGDWFEVGGLASMLQNKGKPVITMAELEGSRPASTALEIVPMLDRMMDSGSGATDTLAGMPTRSQVDRTAAGQQLLVEQSEDRIGSELKPFELEMLQKYSEEAYDNYSRFLNMEQDLPKMFDMEELTKQVPGDPQPVPIQVTTYLRNVKFVFLAADRVIDREAKIGKITRFLTILQAMAQTVPGLGALIAEKCNFIYLIQQIANALDITDIDRLFPAFNTFGELLKMRAENAQLSMQNQAMAQGIQMGMKKLEEVNDQTALDIVKDTMTQVQQMMAEQQKGAQNG